MSLLVLAYPTVNATDFAWIQSYRKDHDELYYNIVAPHFTIVFAVNDITEAIFVDEISRLSKGFAAIEFEINKAIIHKDAFSDYYHEFLIPGKGFTEIVQLHDKLYSQKLFPYLRTDIQFIPHIGIGGSKDIDPIEKRRNKIVTPLIKGSIEALTIAGYENKIVSKITTIQLH